ncbi:MAG: hypothetical protein IJE04_04915 [Bacilli bacterium]|nr:hypothetical protein [Bacilli bacterium]
MKKYNVFCLYVIEKEAHKFICENIIDNEYREVLTKEKLVLEENDKVKSLTRYYSILAVATYKNGQILNPLMLTKKDILLKYLEINEKVVSKTIDIDDFLKRQQEELEGLKILAKECPELAKEYSQEKLEGAGILDENGELIGPYKYVFVKTTDKQKTLDKK